MRKYASRALLNGAIGFSLGLAVWYGLSEPYTRLLAALSESAIRVAERPAVTRITPQGTLMAIDRSDVPPSASGQPGVASTDITFNFILLMTLFAARRGAFSDRNVSGFAGAALLLVFVHIAAVVAFVQMFYVEAYGESVASRYGTVARHFWGSAPYFYGIIGVYGSAVALWWLLRAPDDRLLRLPQRARA